MARNARDMGSSPTLVMVFPIFITPTTIYLPMKRAALIFHTFWTWGLFYLSGVILRNDKKISVHSEISTLLLVECTSYIYGSFETNLVKAGPIKLLSF